MSQTRISGEGRITPNRQIEQEGGEPSRKCWIVHWGIEDTSVGTFYLNPTAQKEPELKKGWYRIGQIESPNRHGDVAAYAEFVDGDSVSLQELIQRIGKEHYGNERETGFKVEKPVFIDNEFQGEFGTTVKVDFLPNKDPHKDPDNNPGWGMWREIVKKYNGYPRIHSMGESSEIIHFRPREKSVTREDAKKETMDAANQAIEEARRKFEDWLYGSIK